MAKRKASMPFGRNMPPPGYAELGHAALDPMF
jgi:hypothetical protein